MGLHSKELSSETPSHEKSSQLGIPIDLEHASSTLFLSRWKAWVPWIVELCRCIRMRSTWFAACSSPTYPDMERGSERSLHHTSFTPTQNPALHPLYRTLHPR